jgi:hypothetical protein
MSDAWIVPWLHETALFAEVTPMKIVSVLLLLGLSACASADRKPHPAAPAAEASPSPVAPPAAALEPSPSPPPSRPAENPWAEATRKLLAPTCGRCHQGDLPTSLPKALAVFNLAETPWYSHIRPEQFDGMLRRVRGSKDISEADKAVVESFVRCARDGACNEGKN